MKRSIFVPALSLTILFFTLGLADSSGRSPGKNSHDWPQWRGVNRNAVSSETGLVRSWPDEGPEVVWRIKVGAGYSSVSVSGGKLYTLWDEKEGQFLVCLDAQTGKELWRRELGAAFNHHYGNGPRSTPLIDDGTVYAIGTQGWLLAVNRDSGESLWRHNLAGEFGSKLPSYGYSSSPLVVGDKLYVEAGGKNAAYIAFNKGTGEVVWASQHERPAYSSPLDVSIGGIRQVVFWSAHGLRSVSPHTGEVLWKYSWETFCQVSGDPLNTATPIFIAPDRIFVSSGSGAAVIRISRDDNAFNVQTVWKSDQMRNDVNSSVLLGDHIYGFDKATLKCIDARTGEVKWKARGFERGSLIAADGQLIVLGENGNLALVDADPEAFVERGKAGILDGRCWTSPALADGKLYLRNHEELVCLNMKGHSSRASVP